MRGTIAVVGGLMLVMLLLACPPGAQAGLLLEYKFNETGTTAPNTAPGADSSTTLNLRDATGDADPCDLHTADGTGVSGLAGDRAINTNYTGTLTYEDQSGTLVGGIHSADVAAVDALQSFTVAGWMNAEPLAGREPRLVDNMGTGNQGFSVSIWGYDTALLVCYVGSGGGFTAPESDMVYPTGSLVFFAVSYDGSLTADNVLFYKGDTANSVALVSTRTADRGTLADEPYALSVANRDAAPGAGRAFLGMLDNIRLYGSKTDGTGALTQPELEALRHGDTIPDIRGDADHDGDVDDADLSLLLTYWDDSNNPTTWEQGDFDGDQDSGDSDLSWLLTNWPLYPPPAGDAVPEPATLAMLAVGAVVLLRRSRPVR